MAIKTERISRARSLAGYSVIELLFVIVLAAVVAGIAAPPFLVALDRQRSWAAARYLAARMTMARSYAVTHSAHVALRFIGESSDVMFFDDNHNGVRTVDVASKVDRAIGAPSRLSELFPGGVIGILGDIGTDAVRIGPTNLMSFTPLATATPGFGTFRGRDDGSILLMWTSWSMRGQPVRSADAGRSFPQIEAQMTRAGTSYPALFNTTERGPQNWLDSL